MSSILRAYNALADCKGLLAAVVRVLAHRRFLTDQKFFIFSGAVAADNLGGGPELHRGRGRGVVGRETHLLFSCVCFFGLSSPDY